MLSLCLCLQGCLIPVPGKLCPGQTDEEYRTEFSLWSISNSALIVATDVYNLTDLQKEVRSVCVSVCESAWHVQHICTVVGFAEQGDHSCQPGQTR